MPQIALNLTFIFDSNVEKITCTATQGTYEWTSSGQTVNGYFDVTLTYYVTFKKPANITAVTGLADGSEPPTIDGYFDNHIDNVGYYFRTMVSAGSDATVTVEYELINTNIQIPITSNGTTTLATKGTKNEEDIDINVNISPTIQSLSITPSETSQTFNASSVDGYKPVNVSAIQTETPTVTLSLASGNQTVNASSGKYIKSLTITKPSTLIASNIRSGVSIAGVSGSLSPAKTEQTKSTTITENGTTTITPDSGKVLSSVSVTTNVPTYITVASESALPSTAEEGTIAVIVGGE